MGGVAATSNLVGHWEKRNRDAHRALRPGAPRPRAARSLFERYGATRYRERLDQLDAGPRLLSLPDEDPPTLDEFAASRHHRRRRHPRRLHEQLHFGCEADDPDDRARVRSASQPLRPRLQALFASDIGHWDVPDMREVLPEAWELVEDGDATEADFRALTFEHPVSLWASTNPRSSTARRSKAPSPGNWSGWASPDSVDVMTTVVLVHGAFHDGWVWEPVRNALDEDGVPNLALDLPFTGLDGDAAAVGKLLDAIDGPVVLRALLRRDGHLPRRERARRRRAPRVPLRGAGGRARRSRHRDDHVRRAHVGSRRTVTTAR